MAIAAELRQQTHYAVERGNFDPGHPKLATAP
jgi:hypothetical protein